jgi:hypothetical protein
MLEGAINYFITDEYVNNTTWPQFSDKYRVMFEYQVYKLNENSNYDDFVVPFKVYNVPQILNSDYKTYNLYGFLKFRASKSDGNYRSLSTNGSHITMTECSILNI